VSEQPSVTGSAPVQAPGIDFSQFGPIDSQPLSRIQKVVASTLTRNWQSIPHVTHHEDADTSRMEARRSQLALETGKKITPLAFLVKASVEALKAFPHFNASLDGDRLILKKYFHIGIAVDTPKGLLVPVIRDADVKSLAEIATEIADVSELARGKGLPMQRMIGGCFTISSLGSIGGTGFTPIINAPELAVMGVSRVCEKPMRAGDGIEWKKMLPLSLSYDHRVINGGDAARFCLAFAAALG
jgi:pyruvate dehydrogenase E2 component (dihydrolipoamide acetyltransferase)